MTEPKRPKPARPEAPDDEKPIRGVEAKGASDQSPPDADELRGKRADEQEADDSPERFEDDTT